MCSKIQHPGKMEGEPCITEVAHYWAMDGGGDSTEDDNGTLVDTFDGPFTEEEIAQVAHDGIEVCQECKTALLAGNRLVYWEDSNGFAYSELS